jgi:hypothetical protein
MLPQAAMDSLTAFECSALHTSRSRGVGKENFWFYSAITDRGNGITSAEIPRAYGHGIGPSKPMLR